MVKTIEIWADREGRIFRTVTGSAGDVLVDQTPHVGAYGIRYAVATTAAEYGIQLRDGARLTIGEFPGEEDDGR